MRHFNLKIANFIFVIVASMLQSSLFAQSGSVSRPNIVVITTDQQFADAMSFRMGKKWINTPNMDKLASEGVFFTRAYASNPICVPSRNSIITGLYPHTTDIMHNDDLANWGKKWNAPKDSLDFWTDKGHRSLGTYFKNAGYETAYFGKWHLNYDIDDKSAHGFETVGNFPKPIIDDTIPGAVAKFLKKPRQKPILFWASFINPHDICQLARFQDLPEGPIARLPDVKEWPPLPDNLAPPQNETEGMTLMRKLYQQKATFPVGDYSQFDWRRLAWGYYRLIEKVDARLGKLMQVLKINGYDKNTIIVFTSDHGECLGAHRFNQKTVFYEESARIPFIINYKDKISSGVNNTLVNVGVDLLPTILDFAGIKQPKALPGTSLKRDVQKNKATKSREYIVVENKMLAKDPESGETVQMNGRMVRGERYKYCLYDILNHREALFDMENDSGETINIAELESSKDIVQKYREYLKEFANTNKDELALNMLEDLK